MEGSDSQRSQRATAAGAEAAGGDAAAAGGDETAGRGDAVVSAGLFVAACAATEYAEGGKPLPRALVEAFLASGGAATVSAIGLRVCPASRAGLCRPTLQGSQCCWSQSTHEIVDGSDSHSSHREAGAEGATAADPRAEGGALFGSAGWLATGVGAGGRPGLAFA